MGSRMQISGYLQRLLLILTAASLLVLASLLYPGRNVHADDLPVIHVSGTLTEDTTWSLAQSMSLTIQSKYQAALP